MNVIYSLSNLDDWVEIVDNMREREGWIPVIWLSTDTLLPQIKNKFPQCQVQGYMAGNRGELDNFSLGESFEPLDKKTILEYAECEKTILKMMDRMDPTQSNFTHTQRISLYYSLLTYWTNIFKRDAIDCVVFNEMPHFPLDYMLYCVAEKNATKVLRFSPTHVDSRILLSSTLETIPKYLSVYETDKNLPEEIEAYLTKLEGDYSNAVPFYMKNVLDNSFSVKSLRRWLTQGYKYLFTAPSSALRTRQGYVENTKIPGIYMGYYRIWGNIYKRSLQNTYNTLVKSISLNENYIYVPLHYQPEKTTTPEGGIFTDQYLMICMLSKSVPKGWKIYVKEHASQFSTTLYGERGRSATFYHDLVALGNVELVSMSYEAFSLMDSAKSIATITGTSALEAVNRGKYAFLFGYPWFRSCEGMVPVENKQDILTALEKIKQGNRPNKQKIRDFFSSVEQHSVKGYTAGGATQKISQLQKESNVENMTKLLQKYASRI